jgi:hypothetical protein
MAAADDIENYQQGTTGDPANPYVQGWMSRIRARKVLGDNVKKEPYTRIWGAIKAVASPMQQDKITAIADAVGWRRTTVNTSNGVPPVVDVGDMILVQWEAFLLTVDPAVLKQALINAGLLEKWPANFPGAAVFEQGT